MSDDAYVLKTVLTLMMTSKRVERLFVWKYTLSRSALINIIFLLRSNCDSHLPIFSGTNPFNFGTGPRVISEKAKLFGFRILNLENERDVKLLTLFITNHY